MRSASIMVIYPSKKVKHHLEQKMLAPATATTSASQQSPLLYKFEFSEKMTSDLKVQVTMIQIRPRVLEDGSYGSKMNRINFKIPGEFLIALLHSERFSEKLTPGLHLEVEVSEIHSCPRYLVVCENPPSPLFLSCRIHRIFRKLYF